MKREDQQDATIRCFCLNMFWASLCPKHVETEVKNKHLNVATCWFFLSTYIFIFVGFVVQEQSKINEDRDRDRDRETFIHQRALYSRNDEEKSKDRLGQNKRRDSAFLF